MRIILDECLPRVFAQDLPGHSVETVQQAGFAGAKNGELLKHIAGAGFDVFITVDKNLPSEQRIPRLAVRHSRHPGDVEPHPGRPPLARKALEAMATLKPGRIAVVGR